MRPPAALLQLKKQMELKKIDDEKVKQGAAADDDFLQKYKEMNEERKRLKGGKGSDQKVIALINFKPLHLIFCFTLEL